MRILGSVVLPRALLVASRQAQLRRGRRIDRSLSVTSVLGAKPCFLSNLRMSLAAALASHRRLQIEKLALVVDRPPEPESSAADQDSHLVEVPLRGWPMTSAAKFPGEQRPELQHTHRLIVS
jgi:hypothetical protein